MIKIIAGIFCLLFTTMGSAEVLSIADQMPEYPGGLDSLLREVSAKIAYPQACRDSNIQGKVFLHFIVNEDGSISNIEAKAPHPLLKAAAINAIKTVGKFKPGMDKGKVVKVWYSVPVSFKIEVVQTANPINISSLPPPQPNKDDNKNEIGQGKRIIIDTNAVYKIIEDFPKYPGDIEGLMGFIGANIEYPELEKEKGIGGRVLLRFIIDRGGNVTDATVLRGISEGLDKEAVRVASLLPKFIPGHQDGKAVKVYFTIPVSFTLPGAHDPGFWGHYPGGRKAFDKFISSNLHYPANVASKNIEANVLVRCKLNKDLKLIPVAIINDIDHGFSEEAMRAISVTAKFDKAIKGSIYFDAEKVIEIPFRLQADTLMQQADSSLSNTYYETGVNSYRIVRYATAVNEFTDAIKSCALNADAYYNRGVTKLKLNDPTGACDDFKRAYLLGELDALKGIQQSCK